MISGLKSNPGIAVLVTMAFLGGCTVGPNYQRPGTSPPEAFRGAPVPATTNSLADLAWWDIYKDPVLAGYIRIALTNNFDVRIAVTRVEQARQLARQAKSQFLPAVGYEGALGYGKNEFAGSASPDSQENDSAIVLANAFWEVDLWGRIRRLNESARAEYLATEEARRGIQLSLVSGVAQAYFELLALDLQLEIAKRTTNSFGETLQIFNLRFGRGIVSKLEIARAEAALASAAATVPDLERQIALKENEISVLLGRPPGPIGRAAKLLDQYLPVEIPTGLPSSLLERRPDLRQAEQYVRSANANVGVAMAEFFPKIGLTAFAGKVSPELSAFTAGSANAWSLAANATGPIFQGGALRAQYRQAKAAWDQACLQYEQTALNALQEVAGALITREKLDAMREQQARAVAAYSEAVEISMERYVTGTAQYFEVLDSQLQLFPAENTLAQIELSRYLAIVQLYRALGGGWQMENSKE
jgi:multidrug efflux system outer membrane protein